VIPALQKAPYFSMTERMEVLRGIARSWIGTPFYPHGREKGPHGGVSCQTLCGLIYQEAGFIPSAFEIPSGRLDTGFQSMEFFLSELVADRFERIPGWEDGGILPGDLLLFRWHRAGHMAIAVPRIEGAAVGQFIHCLRHSGTTLRRLDDPTYARMLELVWRPVCPVS
jgi:cell wall-associated NlpC family hydrolase